MPFYVNKRHAMQWKGNFCSLPSIILQKYLYNPARFAMYLINVSQGTCMHGISFPGTRYSISGRHHLDIYFKNIQRQRDFFSLPFTFLFRVLFRIQNYGEFVRIGKQWFYTISLYWQKTSMWIMWHSFGLIQMS